MDNRGPGQSAKNVLKRILVRTGLLKLYTDSKLIGLAFRLINKRELKRASQASVLKLHLGCGGRILPGWINIDSVGRPHILVSKLPQGLKVFRENTVDYIYSCHFLEHLEYPREVRELLRACHRLLKPGGVIRVGVPDIELIIKAYVGRDQDFFRVQSRLHPAWCTTPLQHLMYALQQDGEHKYGFDFETLEGALHQAGFPRVIKSDFGKSEHGALKVDYHIDCQQGDHLTLYVEAEKPAFSRLPGEESEDLNST